MGKRYLIDTNAIIEYLENKLPDTASVVLDNTDIQISVISRMELLAWRKASEAQLKVLNGFINSSYVFGLNEPIILKTIETRRNYGVKLPDAIIAATALVNDCILVTRNIDDFKKITGLTCINPHVLK
ncbi:MAG TPA: type II toxin-antitoxin system VapC family toxin [Mucilaginibacter sp.]|nr:type II toxin-antitoxin system VapC family toxin [Mucilaginibacter sp.]